MKQSGYAWVHNALCKSSKVFCEGSDIDAAAALEKVSGAQLRLPGRYMVVKSYGASSKRHR